MNTPMISIQTEVHFWSSKDDIVIADTDFGAFKYHDKKDTSSDSLYLEGKKLYTAGQGKLWQVGAKKSSPLKRDAFKELEDQLKQNRMVRSDWVHHNLLYILLSSGLFIYITVSHRNGDILEIIFDKYLLGKLPSDCITDVVFGKNYFLLSYSEALLTVIHKSKPRFGPRKLTRQDPKLSVFDLVGPTGRRLERKLSLNCDESLILVWWKSSQDEVYPWSPVVRDCDRANLLIYSINKLSQIQLICYYKTEGDPIDVTFSNIYKNILLLVEQRVSRNGEVSLENSSFEISSTGQLLRSPTVGALQLKTYARCISRSPDESRLAVGCIDGSVLLHSPSSTLLVKTAFIPSLISWHPDGILIIIATEKSQLQCFDLALAPVKLQLIGEEYGFKANLLDLTTYFRYQPTLNFIGFNKSNDIKDLYSPSDGYLLLCFERGPCVILRLSTEGGYLGGLTPEVIISQYINLGIIDCAINLLSALNWDTQGTVCLSCMHKICNHLFTLPLTNTVEEQLEAVLGTFMSPSVPLSISAENQFGPTMHHLARRFFLHLLRYQRFEKSFRLAIDLGDKDLFLDLYHCAKSIGDENLAIAAKNKAEEIEQQSGDESTSASESATSSCDCSRSSCSICGGSETESGSSCTESSDQDEVIERNKSTKVTFSDTVTHIVAITSAEEDGDDEDDEVQALTLSFAPSTSMTSSSSSSWSNYYSNEPSTSSSLYNSMNLISTPRINQANITSLKTPQQIASTSKQLRSTNNDSNTPLFLKPYKDNSLDGGAALFKLSGVHIEKNPNKTSISQVRQVPVVSTISQFTPAAHVFSNSSSTLSQFRPPPVISNASAISQFRPAPVISNSSSTMSKFRPAAPVVSNSSSAVPQFRPTPVVTNNTSTISQARQGQVPSVNNFSLQPTSYNVTRTQKTTKKLTKDDDVVPEEETQTTSNIKVVHFGVV